MIIWKGWGILLIAIGVVFLLLTEVVVEAAIGNDAYFQEATWPMFLALVLSAAVIWPLGRWLNRPSGRVLVDRETGEEVMVGGGDHSFFFIKLQYWAPILVVMGLLFFWV